MKTLIIKLGALGDVVRTTPILRALTAETTWVTREEALPLLPRAVLASALDLEQAAALRGAEFDMVLCLDDEPQAAALAASVKAGRRIGTTMDVRQELCYTDEAAAWFDMGLVSRLGKAEADRRKMANTRTYQELLFAMLGKTFSGEEYLIDLAGHRRRTPGQVLRVGLEGRAGPRWPMKCWRGFSELAGLLEKDGRQVVHFRQRESLAEFIGDVAACDAVVCGDTLTMHLALALGIPTVALFICTSPAEIYGYGRLAKVVSPLWKEYFYQREYSPEPGQAIAASEVHEKIGRALAEPRSPA
jgi:heptosyltransferase-2